MNPRWQSEIDRELERISKETDLPGTGKPLQLNHNSHIPADQQAAYKIMKDHDALPEWIMLNKELDHTQAHIQNTLKRRWQEYQLGLAGAKSVEVRAHVEKVWQAAQKKAEALIRAYNDKVLTYNLKVPPGITHRRMLHWHQALEAAKKAD